MQVASSHLTKGSTNSGQDGAPACQLTNRKARNTKQLDVQIQSAAGSSLPNSSVGVEDAEYASLIGAMDNDLDRPDPPTSENLQELSSQTVQTKGNIFCQKRRSAGSKRRLRSLFFLSAGLESKGKLRGKAKAQKKREEKEKKSSVKTPGDDLKDNLADNDDSSSTTTETSNPDVETNIKEVPRHNSSSLPHNKEVVASTWTNMKVAKSASSNERLWWFLIR